MEDQDALIGGEDDVRLEEEGAGPDNDLFEIELDGETYALPPSLKGAFLRQADYTRKTQELAEHRRAVEAERLAAADERRALRKASGDRATLHALDAQLDAFEEVDWDGLAQDDPGRARDLWASYQETAQLREQFAYALSHREAQDELTAAREAAEAMTATGAKLREEIEGWSPEVAAKLVDYAQAFGVTLEELAEAADPRLWKLLHRAWQAEQASAVGPEGPAVQPAVTLTGVGGGAGGVRDELSTREWMRRRAEQTGRAR